MLMREDEERGKAGAKTDVWRKVADMELHSFLSFIIRGSELKRRWGKQEDFSDHWTPIDREVLTTEGDWSSVSFEVERKVTKKNINFGRKEKKFSLSVSDLRFSPICCCAITRTNQPKEAALEAQSSINLPYSKKFVCLHITIHVSMLGTNCTAAPHHDLAEWSM